MSREVASLAQVAQQVRPVTLARHRTLPVSPSLATLLPDGLPRGSLVAVDAAPGVPGTTSLALLLAAGPSADGAWVAVVGLQSLGLVAAVGLGVASERLVRVAAPDRRSQLSSVVAALVDGFDVVVIGPEARRRLGHGDGRRLMARVRERGGVLLTAGDDLPGGSAQVRLRVVSSRWEGLHRGAGHLRSRRVVVEAGGRGAASRPRRTELLLPDNDGQGSTTAGVRQPDLLLPDNDNRDATTAADGAHGAELRRPDDAAGAAAVPASVPLRRVG